MRKIFGVRRRIGTEKEKEEYIWRRKIFGPQNRRRMEREREEDI